MVLVLLGLGAAFVLPTLRLAPSRTRGDGPLERARATAIRRGESMRLSMNADGRWTVRATADTGGTILLSGSAAVTPDAGAPPSIVITALGACLPEGGPAVGAGAWDPARCAAVRH